MTIIQQESVFWKVSAHDVAISNVAWYDIGVVGNSNAANRLLA